MSSSSSSEKLNYSGGDDVDWKYMHPALDTNKYFHLAEEEMHIATPRIESQSGGASIVEHIISFINHHLSSVVNIVWLKLLQEKLHQPK